MNKTLLKMNSETLILIEGLCYMFQQRQSLRIPTMVLGSMIPQRGITELSTISFVFYTYD